MRRSQMRLAIDGGTPVWNHRFAPWPIFDDEMIQIVSEVLRSGRVNYWTGDQGEQFEREYAAFLGSRFAIAVSNGTAALELALKAIDLQPGDEVVVPARTFIATASSVVACGGRPVIADVDPETGNISAETVQPVLSVRTRAVIPVHLAGCPCDMDAIMELAQTHRLWVIEDCAQSHGATYHGRPAGALGHLAAFSFCQDKILTTGGEGGLLATDDPELYERAWSYKDHGKSRSKALEKGHPPLFRWLHDDFGTNLRMTEMQAALGRVMLRRLPQWVNQRRKNAAMLGEALASVPGIEIPRYPVHVDHAFYKYYTYLNLETLRSGWTRDHVILAIQREGVPCGSGACAEIYREAAFDKHGLCLPKCSPNAQKIGERSLMFVVHPTLGEEEIHATARAVKKVLRSATSMPRQSLQVAA